MRTRFKIGPLLGLAALVACGAVQRPVPVLGDARALEGEWYGEYQSPSTGRSGSITFTLEAGKDTAQGDVVMTPQGWDHPVEAISQPSIGERARRRTLTISFVRSREGQVTGRLDRYVDPQCGCDVVTIFQGNLRADTLQGTFRTHHIQGGTTRAGEWRAVRKRQ